MGQDKAGGREGGSIRRRHDPITPTRGWPSRCAHLIRGRKPRIVAGLDPGITSPTGYAVLELDGGTYEVVAIGEVPAWRALLAVSKARVVGIDAPLAVPYRGFRGVERMVLRELRSRMLPGGAPGMARLAMMGYSLEALYEEAAVCPLETHPYTIYRILGLEPARSHALDALASAVSAACLVEGEAMVFEDYPDLMVFPRRDCRYTRLLTESGHAANSRHG